MDLRSLWRRFGGPSAAGPGASADAPDGPEAPGATGSGGAATPAAAVERPARPAWRDLEPIPRTVRNHPLVAPTVSFSHGLSGHQAAPLALETLGHDRPADAPAGVVSGLFVGHSPHTPIQDDGGGTARASVRGHASRPGDAAGPADSTAGPPRLAGSPAGASPARPLSAGGGASAVAIVPAHRPVVARAVASHGGSAAMTSAPTPSSAAPAGTIGRPAVAGSTPTAGRPEPGGTGASAGSPGAHPVPAISVTAGPVEPGASVLHAGTRHNLGQTRRLRIGPAIGPDALDPTDPDRAGAPRSSRSDAAEPAAPRLDPLRDLSVIGAVPAEAGAPSGPVSTSFASTAPAVARSALQREPADEAAGADGQSPEDLRSAALTGPLQPVPSRPIAPPRPVERAPLVGGLEVGRGSRPRSSAGRSGGDGPGTSPRPDAPTPRSTVQEALAALSGAIAPSPTGPVGGLGGSTGAGLASSPAGAAFVPVQRSADDASPALTAGPGWSVDPTPGRGPHAPVGGAPTVARSAVGGSSATATTIARAGGTWAAPIRQLRSTSAPRIESPRHGGGHATIGVVASRSFASATLGTAGDGPDPAGATAWPSGGPAGDGGSGDETAPAGATAPPIQRLETLAAPSAPVVSAGMPTVLRAGEGGDAGSGGGAAGAGGSDKELDELARRLFPRLQLRLRSELLIDRERIGALVDLGR